MRDSLGAGYGPGEAKTEDLKRAGQEMAETDIDIPTEQLRDILDARSFLTSRASTGSVHPDEVSAHCKSLHKALAAHRDWHEAKQRAVDDAIGKLEARAKELAAA